MATVAHNITEKHERVRSITCTFPSSTSKLNKRSSVVGIEKLPSLTGRQAGAGKSDEERKKKTQKQVEICAYRSMLRI